MSRSDEILDEIVALNERQQELAKLPNPTDDDLDEMRNILIEINSLTMERMSLND